MCPRLDPLHSCFQVIRTGSRPRLTRFAARFWSADLLSGSVSMWRLLNVRHHCCVLWLFIPLFFIYTKKQQDQIFSFLFIYLFFTVKTPTDPSDTEPLEPFLFCALKLSASKENQSMFRYESNQILHLVSDKNLKIVKLCS